MVQDADVLKFVRGGLLLDQGNDYVALLHASQSGGIMSLFKFDFHRFFELLNSGEFLSLQGKPTLIIEGEATLHKGDRSLPVLVNPAPVRAIRKEFAIDYLRQEREPFDELFEPVLKIRILKQFDPIVVLL